EGALPPLTPELVAPTIVAEDAPKKKGKTKWVLLLLLLVGAGYYLSEYGMPV
ncbi:MAG TPA: hypothetical protein HA356_03590, partial [Candidatus Poseidoniaceae archaeon]|nr:hypothetical protein [Candidatus Poseidoniaceae archaeon]